MFFLDTEQPMLHPSHAVRELYQAYKDRTTIAIPTMYGLPAGQQGKKLGDAPGSFLSRSDLLQPWLQ